MLLLMHLRGELTEEKMREHKERMKAKRKAASEASKAASRKVSNAQLLQGNSTLRMTCSACNNQKPPNAFPVNERKRLESEWKCKACRQHDSEVHRCDGPCGEMRKRKEFEKEKWEMRKQKCRRTVCIECNARVDLHPCDGCGRKRSREQFEQTKWRYRKGRRTVCIDCTK